MLKKLIISVFSYFTFTLTIQAQENSSTFIDAATLAKLYTAAAKAKSINFDNIKKSFFEILKKYGINEENINSNSFLKDIVLIPPPAETIKPISGVIGRAPASEGSMESVTMMGMGGASKKAFGTAIEWQASAVNGIANFMAGRFKQELLQVAIDQIFTKISKHESAAVLNAIFPKTCIQMQQLASAGNATYYTTDLVVVKQAAQIDLEEITNNLVDKFDAIFPENKLSSHTKDVFRLVNYALEYSQKDITLDKLLRTIGDEHYSNNSIVKKVISITSVLSDAVTNFKDENNNWVEPLQELPIAAINEKGSIANFFYAILAMQLKKTPEFKSFITTYENNTNLLATHMQSILAFVGKLNNTYNYVKEKNFRIQNSTEAINYLKDIVGIVSTLSKNLYQIPEIKTALNIPDSLFSKTNNYLKITEVVLKKEFQKVIPLLLIEFNDKINLKGNTARTLTFLSQMALVENANDMEAILQAYALPIGSSSIKRNSKLNLSFNGYVGITGGSETAYGSKQNQTKTNIGLTAPIGISATFGNGSTTAFFSLIDLGSVVNQRLKNNINTFNNLRFEHFFTPGAGLYYNFKKLPFTAGAHFSFVPNLRNIQYQDGTATITDTNTNVTRFNISFLVDIPFFTIYHK